MSIALARESRPLNESLFWNPGFIPPAVRRKKSVVTVHDLTHLHFYSKFHRSYYDAVLRPLYRKCDRIVCVSQFTKSEFCEWSGISEERVDVIHNGVSEIFFSASRPRIDHKFVYVLYPGNYRNYKNISRLLDAYAMSRLPSAGIHLALTGNGNLELKSKIEALGLKSTVRFLGFLNQRDLVSAYRSASAVAFISLYEGFGLPLVEAMATETPVLAASSSCLPEIGGAAALYIDPLSIDDISSGLERIIFDQSVRSELVEAGRHRARQFSWDSSATALKDVFRKVCG